MRRELRSDRGTSLVEFAIVLPLLFLLVFGLIEFGLLFYNKAVITNASREGARAGIVYDTKTGTYPHDKAYITMVINSYTRDSLVTFRSNLTPHDPIPANG
jgi:Flp pilus assembly protein TadG